MIAMALINSPKLLIADEPTTALDVTVQAQILELIERLQAETGTAVIMITHDLGVVAEMTHEIAVMYAGRIVERAPTAELFAAPAAPVHVGSAALDPAAGLAARRGAGADRGQAAVADHAAARLRLPPALPVRARGAQAHRPRCWSRSRAARDHDVACLLSQQTRSDLWQHLAAGEAPASARAAVPLGDSAE